MINVVYVGKDIPYFESIKKRFLKEFTAESFDFFQVYSNYSLDEFHRLLIDIEQKNPNIIFLDYSSDPQKMLTLARTIPRSLPEVNSIIGLWEYLSPTYLVDEGNITGIPISHIKSGEITEVVMHAMYLYKEGAFSLKKYAKADIYSSFKINVYHQMKIGYLSSQYLHIEHDFIPSNLDKVRLTLHFNNKIPNIPFSLKREIDKNFYYHYRHASDFYFKFIPDMEIPENESKKEKLWREGHEKEASAKWKLQVDKYIDEYPHQNSPKRTKMLILDKELDVIRQAPKPLDSYKYSIRFYKELVTSKNIIHREMAGIIVYQCPKGSEGDLTLIVDRVKEIQNYNPFIIVFNSHWETEKLKEHYSYEHILSIKGNFHFDTLLTMAKSYEEQSGRKKTHDQQQSFHNKEKRVYFDKNRVESYAEYHFEAELRELTEAYIKIQTKEQLPIWSIYQMNAPVRMSITVFEKLDEADWKKEGFQQYLCVIHCIGEKERASLRRKVNAIIKNEKELLEIKAKIEKKD